MGNSDHNTTYTHMTLPVFSVSYAQVQLVGGAAGRGHDPGQQHVHPKPSTLNPKPQTLNPKPQTLNPKPQILNAKR